jgi:aryl-alcohol dehydrogenase-like predicted oxidoreductase
VRVGTKVRVPPAERGRIAAFVRHSLEQSLERLGRERVDLLQLHNPISEDGRGNTIAAAAVLGEVVPALARLREEGKTRFVGITALGDTAALHRVIDARAVDSAQVCCNLLNPSAAAPLPPGFPAQDFGGLLARARAAGAGAIGIRVLAGGALSGVEERHPVAVPTVEPIASGADYRADVERARRLASLVREGHAESLVEASFRFALGSEGMTTVLVGYSSLEQLELAALWASRGPLPAGARARLDELWKALAAPA